MAAPKLVASDFKVFTIEGFKPRMEAFNGQLRPKLVALGEHLAPSLTDLVGHPMYVHVAKHARRTVNPPDESWCAFASKPRGYKALPHFAVCVSRGGTHARLVLKDEALTPRTTFAKYLDKHATALAKKLHALGARDYHGWDCVTLPEVIDEDRATLKELARQTALKTGTFSVGIAFDKWPGDKALLEAFGHLNELYSHAQR